MNVKCALETIDKLVEICDKIFCFNEQNEDREYFLDDAVNFLGDYRRVLEKAIEEAELRI